MLVSLSSLTVFHPCPDLNLRGIVLLLQLTKKIPTETMGRPTIRESVNSSLRKKTPKRTPKIGVKNVKAESRLTEY
jgi:hypothetical protein